MRDLAAQDLPYERKMLAKEEAKAYFDQHEEPLKVQLIRGEGRPRRFRVTRSTMSSSTSAPGHTSRQRASSRRSRCSAVRTPTGRGTRRTNRCSGIYGTAFFKDAALERASGSVGGGEEARPPQARAGVGTVQLSPLGARRPVLASERHHALQPARGATCGTCCAPREILSSGPPLVFNRQLWETSGHWEHYRENMFLV